MASKIEWTDETWNPVVGCQVVSPGCTNCYAMKIAGRLEAMARADRDSHFVPGPQDQYLGTTQKTKAGFVWTGKIGVASGEVFAKPLRWRRPSRIFVNSLGDLFAVGVRPELLVQVFATMMLTPQHQYQVLTKRPGAMRDYVRELATSAGLDRLMFTWVNHPTGRLQLIDLVDPIRVSRVLPNVLLGASVENQLYAHSRRDFLRDVAGLGWKTFVSYEPALGEVDWTGWEFLHWLIAGGESGPDARPMHPDWARIARDFCAEHGILFFFKQWGEWAPGEANSLSRKTLAERGAHYFDDRWEYVLISAAEGAEMHCDDEPDVWRIGKRHSGRLLDGVEHNAMPEVVHG